MECKRELRKRKEEPVGVTVRERERLLCRELQPAGRERKGKEAAAVAAVAAAAERFRVGSCFQLHSSGHCICNGCLFFCDCFLGGEELTRPGREEKGVWARKGA
ncbi:hypothetical protein Cni_G10380 [Canna indica]|uniref:Uncharacterized protein n=1 Tax=Canna indica TaxID=4628 RepID=A0AAQ3QA95_9LILI|nr:hypothetical protein Cni_G10380 [Canna indica]